MASNYKKTIVLGLDYSEFSGGVTECNRKMGLLTAEFDRATEEAKLYGTASDQLRLKHDYLTQKIELQKKKVEAATAAYDKATTSNKKNEKAVDSAQKAVTKQETALLKLEGQLRDTEKEMDKSTKFSTSFGDSIRGTAEMFGIEMNPALEKFAERFDGVNKDLVEGAALVAGVVAVYADLSIELSKTADNLLTLSSTSGLSTDTLQELQYASEFVDVSVETLNGSMTKMIRSMDKARDGNKELRKSFAKLSVQYKDGHGNLVDAEKTFYAIIDALGKMTNETERDSIAMEIFGRSARDLNPLIEAGSGRLRELSVEAHEVGYVLGNDVLQSAGALDDEMQQMNRKLETVKMQLGIALLPILTTLVDLLNAIPTPVLTTIAIFGSFLIIMKSVTMAIGAFKAVAFLGAAANAALGLSGATATASMAPLLLILLGIAAAIALIVGGASSVSSAMNDVESAGNSVVNAAQKSSQAVKPHHARGTNYFGGGETWVGEEGPELVELPRGSRIHSARDSKRMGSGGDTYIFNIESKSVQEFNRLVEMAKRQQMVYRTGVAKI